ncbi:MAG: sulfatase [Rhodopirellula sp. JB055]|uniref:sulfatase family protein n=1 Tax=Rhodopirellula sp. JB055 TaxID=3342846 RepID=UPI00370B2E32
MRNQPSLLLASSCLIFATIFSSGAVGAESRPNFLFVLTDDQSYGMMGCDGNELTRTPNIDQLAREGVFFDRAYVTSAICTPSRISIFLSQYERKHGVNFNSGTSVAPEAWAKSYPVIMRENGYYTGYVGKNHAPIGKGGYNSGLMEESFDYFYAGHGHIRFYPKDVHEIFEGAAYDTQVEIVNEGAQDFLSYEHRLDGAVRFLDERPADKPFCLSICLNLPHSAGTGTMQQRESDDEIYKSLYRDIEIPLPEHYVAKDEIETPRLPADVLRASERQASYDFVDTPEALRERTLRQMQSMTGIDRLIGNLRTKLETEGVDDNTIIIFCSDHGLFMGQHGLGGKALCYEQTTHVPMIVFDPELPTVLRGARCNELVQTIDIAATMLDLAGIEKPNTFQGLSLRPLLSGKGGEIRAHVFTENLWVTHFGNPRIEAVQDKRWKYIRYYRNDRVPASVKIQAAKDLGMKSSTLLYGIHDNEIAVYRHHAEASLRGEEPIYEELFDLENDPDELNNLIDNPAAKSQLEELRGVWKQQLTDARGEGFPAVLRYTADSEKDYKSK